MKEEVLNKCIEDGNEFGYISWDGILDNCDEDRELIDFCVEELERLKSEGKINFELDI